MHVGQSRAVLQEAGLYLAGHCPAPRHICPVKSSALCQIQTFHPTFQAHGSPHFQGGNPHTETQASEPNILAQLCVTWHISSSDSVQEVPIAVKELSSPLHDSLAEDLVTCLPCLQLFQPLVTG